MLVLAALLISDKKICPQISNESRPIIKWIKFWELAKQVVHHFFLSLLGCKGNIVRN